MPYGDKSRNGKKYILLFLFALNLFNQSGLLLAILLVLVIVGDGGRLYVPLDGTFLTMAICAGTTLVFSARNGFHGCTWAIGCLAAYYLGMRLQYDPEGGIGEAETGLNAVILILIAGMTFRASANVIHELVRFGGGRYALPVLGTQTTETGTYLTLFVGAIFYIVLESKRCWTGLAGMDAIAAAFVYGLALGESSFFLVAGASIVMSIAAFMIRRKDASEGLRAWQMGFIIVLVFAVAFAFVYTQHGQGNTGGLRTAKQEYQGFFSFLKTSECGIAGKQTFDFQSNYPRTCGGMTGRVGSDIRALWRYILDYASVIPFVLTVIVTIQITASNVGYIFSKKVPLRNSVLLAGITTSVTAQLFCQPWLTECHTLIFSYFLICGAVKSQKLQYSD